jgi:hypothetical protein
MVELNPCGMPSLGIAEAGRWIKRYSLGEHRRRKNIKQEFIEK